MELFYLKVDRCTGLNDLRKLHEYQRQRSFLTFTKGHSVFKLNINIEIGKIDVKC